MRLVIVTGMSGAGRTTALKVLEDAGYFCVDNLPVPFIDKFAELTASGNSEITKVAIGIDIRSGKSLGQLEQVLEHMTMEGISHEILFLDASDEVLVKRYKETRRMHPLAESGRVEQGITLERERLVFLKKQADYIIDTHTAVAASVYKKYEKETGDTTKTVIASTASPYKFTRSVMNALDPSYDSKTDFELIDELEKLSGVKVPQAIEDIRSAAVLHDTVCETEDMCKEVKKILNIK